MSALSDRARQIVDDTGHIGPGVTHRLCTEIEQLTDALQELLFVQREHGSVQGGVMKKIRELLENLQK